jgi:glycosyltransferase involved in cell wall biosynthesis
MTPVATRQPAGATRVQGAPAETPQVSVVIPVFEEEESLPLLHERLVEVLDRLGRSYEIIYVDDGSRDGTPAALAKIVDGKRRVTAIRFRRNFGQTAALQAGIEHSRGELVVMLDADLQNDPEDINALIEKLEEGYDVVSGWRRDRHDPWLRTQLSRTANGLISWVTGVHLHDYGCTLKVYRREVLEHVRLYGEMHRFIPAIASWSGAAIAEMPVRHHARQFGRSKYGLSRTLRVFLDLMTVKLLGSYSTKPMYFFGFLGFGLWFLAILTGLVVIAERLLPPYPYAHNNPLLLVAVFFAIVGVQLILMGLLAELVIRTYHESQGKPTYVIRQVLEAPPRDT